MRRRRRWARGSLIALAMAASWALGLWLIVLALFSAVVVLARQCVLSRHRLPIRLLAWALHAPHGPNPPVAIEHAIAVDLAVISEGHLDCLDRAQVVLRDGVDDPWRRALAEERLTIAKSLVQSGCLAGVKPHQETSADRFRRSAGAVIMIVLLALGNMTQSRWWLLPLAVLQTLLTIECVHLYESRRGIPELLASSSLQDPIEGLFVMAEHEVARSLVVLAGDDQRMIRRALSLLHHQEVPEHPHAHSRLVLAECLAAEGHDAGRRESD